MTTKSGESVRKDLLKSFDIEHVWDFGDTRLFDAAVLPAVLLLRKKGGAKSKVKKTKFTSIYLSGSDASGKPEAVFSALEDGGDGLYKVRQGTLDTGKTVGDVWRLATTENDLWLETVLSNTAHSFRDLGKIRVGIKTTADNVFIVRDLSVFNGKIPETIEPLITHHVARRYKAESPTRHVVYTHESSNGTKQVIELSKHPNTRKYLESHRAQLANRKYVIESGRNWFEIWVPQNPGTWNKPKLVFRDISEKPMFWADLEGNIVNGDCYWLALDEGKSPDLLWLALAVANSKFIEEFYDHSFNNKLYSGRRRFITQYVEKFPLPNPSTNTAKKIIGLAKEAYALTDENRVNTIQQKLDALVYSSFGVA